MANGEMDEESSCLTETEDGNDIMQRIVNDVGNTNNGIGHFDNVTQVMAYHPRYLEAYLKCQQYMMRGDGPLPYDQRHYIAIMAAARHQCSYLVKSQQAEFLAVGGDPSWLSGLENIPKKLLHLSEVNRVLAHRPWLLKKENIIYLTKGVSENWSLSELAQAIVIMIHFHSLSSFVFGCGINSEAAHAGDQHRPFTDDDSGDDAAVVVETLIDRMQELKDTDEEITQEQRNHDYNALRQQTANEICPEAPVQLPDTSSDIAKFLGGGDFQYEDFARRTTDDDIHSFRQQEFSWEDQGFSLLNRLYNEMGSDLDDKFKIIYDLTYYTMGVKKDIDTTVFRRAVWNYIQSIFGIRHDDYDYSEVNHMLERNLKAFIKTVSCFPHRTTKQDYDQFMKGFKHSEKVHVNLMVVEARMQAELLYALRCIMQYMT